METVRIKQATKQGYALCDIGGGGRLQLCFEQNKARKSTSERANLPDNYIGRDVDMQDRISKRNNFKTIEKYCAYCGKQIKRKFYPGANKFEDFTVFTKRKYCNRLCMRKAFVNIGINNANWSDTHMTARKINALFLHKDKCEICGKTGKLDIHHIDENPNNNNLENLMCLCRSCHMKIHRNESFKKEVMHNE